MTSGRVIMLNGTSSSGKTTLAGAIQKNRSAAGECWLVTGVDDFFYKLPAAWVSVGGPVGEHADDGVVFDTSTGVFEMRMGAVGRRVFVAYRAAVAAMARSGMNVIVDDVMLRAEEWTAWQEHLAGLDVLWVAVDLSLELVEARELARDDRVIGMGRTQFDVVHSFATYDVQVDTGVLSPEQAADAVVAALA